jgi:hypothetical protein
MKWFDEVLAPYPEWCLFVRSPEPLPVLVLSKNFGSACPATLLAGVQLGRNLKDHSRRKASRDPVAGDKSSFAFQARDTSRLGFGELQSDPDTATVFVDEYRTKRFKGRLESLNHTGVQILKLTLEFLDSIFIDTRSHGKLCPGNFN